jgi:hypothetical protein
LWRDPRERHRLLNEPMRANKIPEAERQEWIREQTEARLEALFAEHHVPAEWDELMQWQRLAWSLAGKMYPGLRTIEQGRGGPQKVNRLERQNRKAQLFEKFSAYHAQRKSLSQSRAVKYFIDEHKLDCEAVKLLTTRSFQKAMRAMSEES